MFIRLWLSANLATNVLMEFMESLEKLAFICDRFIPVNWNVSSNLKLMVAFFSIKFIIKLRFPSDGKIYFYSPVCFSILLREIDKPWSLQRVNI